MEPSSRLQSAGSSEVAAVVAELVTNGSVEMGAHRPQDAQAIATLVPAGTPVYVTEVALAFVGCAAIARHGIKDSWLTWRSRLPVVVVGIYIAAGDETPIVGLGFPSASLPVVLAEIDLLEKRLRELLSAKESVR